MTNGQAGACCTKNTRHAERPKVHTTAGLRDGQNMMPAHYRVIDYGQIVLIILYMLCCRKTRSPFSAAANRFRYRAHDSIIISY